MALALLVASRGFTARTALARPSISARTAVRTMCALPDHLVDMKEELESGEAQLFDVREPEEWAAGHLTQAKLVPLSELLEGQVPQYERTTLTYVHCAAGVRVHRAAPTLEAMGFERVVPLSEGFATLASLGFEYER